MRGNEIVGNRRRYALPPITVDQGYATVDGFDRDPVVIRQWSAGEWPADQELMAELVLDTDQAADLLQGLACQVSWLWRNAADSALQCLMEHGYDDEPLPMTPVSHFERARLAVHTNGGAK